MTSHMLKNIHLTNLTRSQLPTTRDGSKIPSTDGKQTTEYIEHALPDKNAMATKNPRDNS